MRLMKDTQAFYKADGKSRQQFEDVFGDTSTYAAEFDPYWNEVILPQIPTVHRIQSEYAGAGSVDYPEAFALYCFVRTLHPEYVLELGYAGGISSACIARGLEINTQATGRKPSLLVTVDRSPEYWDVCDEMKRLIAEGHIEQHCATDAIQFLQETGIPYGLTFTDADHNKELCYGIATLLKEKYPNVIHVYHEWSMGWNAGDIEQSYVSFKHSIGNCYEREAFEHVFGVNYGHGGFYGSCGLGCTMPL